MNQTLGRTVITAGTALLARSRCSSSAARCCKGFAFTMIVGIITGTYSSVFIAAAIAIIWQGAQADRRADGSPPRRAADAGAQAQPPPRVVATPRTS